MPDIRVLLEDVTARHAPHPDPVGAVHRTIRRRAVRRRVALAAGMAAAVAVAAAATALRPSPQAAPVSPATTEGDVRYQTLWRSSASGSFVADEAYESMAALVRDHEDIFVGMRQVMRGSAIRYDVAFSAGVDPEAWTDEVGNAARQQSVHYERCPSTAAELDRAAAEVLSAPWPSGASVVIRNTVWHVTYEFPCTVVAYLDRPPASADRSYAQRRWHGDVELRSDPCSLTSVTPPSTPPSPTCTAG